MVYLINKTFKDFIYLLHKMSDISQSVKMEDVKLATFGETIRNIISFQFFENNSEFIAGVIFGSIMTMSAFQFRNYRHFI